MNTFAFVFLCIQACLVQNVFSQCTSRAAVASELGPVAGPYGIGAPYGYNGVADWRGIGAAPFGYGSLAGCGALAGAPFAYDSFLGYAGIAGPLGARAGLGCGAPYGYMY